MNGFHITPQARRDLVSIWEYISERSGRVVANRVVADFYDAIRLLAEQPLMGHTRADVLNPRYRFWTVHSFVVAYRPDSKPLTISRVVHGARDFKKLFR